MKTNKNIDRLFQEKLKDLEVSPPPSVWEGVQSNLHQKNPKSILPLWLRVSGAAAIMLLLTIGGINYFDTNSNELIITDTNDIKNTPVNENDILNPVLNNSNESNSVITEATQNNDAISEILNVDNTQKEEQIKFNSTTQNSQISDVNNKKGSSLSNSKNDLEKIKETPLSNKSSVAEVNKSNSNSQDTNSKETYSDKFLDLNKKEENSNFQIVNELTNSNKILNDPNNKTLNSNSESKVANSETKTQSLMRANKSANPNEKLNDLNNKILNTDSESTVVNNEKINLDLIKTNESINSNKFLNDPNNKVLNSNFESTVVNNNSKTENLFNPSVTDNTNEIIDYKKEKIGENINIENNLDSIQKDVLSSEEGITLVPNEYDKLLNTDLTEDLKEEEEDAKKWSIASTIAPIYYNSFNTKGSPLDLQFKDNPKTGSKSIAYGIKVGYKLNDKLTLQTGVSKIDVGYKIGNVFINPTSQLERRLTNVNYANSTATILNVNAENFLSDALIETNATTGFTGELNQSFGYIEVPLELKYSITDTSKKLSVNLIGGVSTLLLNKNEVFISTSEFSSSLGEANNLNKVNFSGNIGIDIDYKINKRIYINVAPTLKIHTKTFSNSDSNFEPYLFGVYTGINYRF